MRQPATGMDSDLCAFCHQPAKINFDVGAKEHRDNCLDMNCKRVGERSQPLKRALDERMVLVETRGKYLGTYVFEIPLDLCTCGPNAFETQIKWRIWHRVKGNA